MKKVTLKNVCLARRWEGGGPRYPPTGDGPNYAIIIDKVWHTSGLLSMSWRVGLTCLTLTLNCIFWLRFFLDLYFCLAVCCARHLSKNSFPDILVYQNLQFCLFFKLNNFIFWLLCLTFMLFVAGPVL